MKTPKEYEKSRFDTRMPKKQKELFEKAALLGGYRNLTDFVLTTVQEQAEKIIKEHEQIIASKKDSELFFDAITNPDKPNKDLHEAAKQYNSLLSE